MWCLLILIDAKKEKVVDKSAVLGPSGLTMADDVAFKEPVYMKHINEDPGCDSHKQWQEFRYSLLTVATDFDDFPGLLEDWAFIAHTFLFENLSKKESIDVHAHTCLFGFITALYLLGHYKVHVQNNARSATDELRTLDFYVGAMHPDSMDIRIGGTWPVSSGKIEKLRRDIAKALRNTDKYFGFDLNESFTVYVYSPEEVPQLKPLMRGGSFCKNTQWGGEVQLHQFFLQSKMYTDNAAEADFFFVPQYTACHLNLDTFTREESDEYFKSLMPNLPYFKKTRGRDHIFVFTSGMAVDGPFSSWRDYIPDSIFLMVETELWNRYTELETPSFSIHKDIVIPGMIGVSRLGAQNDAAAGETSFLADFVGWNRPLHPTDDEADSPRERLLAMANNSALHIRQDVPGSDAFEGAAKSIFCFIPRGKSAWTSRLFRTLFADCVPVMLNDYYEVPFSEFLEIHNWMIKWPMKDLDGDALVEKLTYLVENQIASTMLDYIKEDRCWYVFPPGVIDEEFMAKKTLESLCPNWRKQNAFVGIMKLLRRKVRKTKNSPSTFFFPRGNYIVYTDAEFNITW